MQNPDLLPAGADQGNSSYVPPLPAITKPLPNGRVAEGKHYICTVPAASMHRTDGKKLAFVHGYLFTDFVEDIKYLDNEIGNGNMYVREANVDEVHAAHMRIDPRGTMEKSVRAELEPQLRAELEAKIRAEMEAAKPDNLLQKQMREGVEVKATVEADKKVPATSAIAGVDAAARAREILAANKARGSSISVPGATINLGQGANNVPPVPLKPQSTADLAAGAVASGK